MMRWLVREVVLLERSRADVKGGKDSMASGEGWDSAKIVVRWR